MIQNRSRILSTKVSSYFYDMVKISEAANGGVLVKVSLKISQISQKKTRVGVSF